MYNKFTPRVSALYIFFYHKTTKVIFFFVKRKTFLQKAGGVTVVRVCVQVCVCVFFLWDGTADAFLLVPLARANKHQTEGTTAGEQ